MRLSPSRDEGEEMPQTIQDLFLSILSIGLFWSIGLKCSLHLSFLAFISVLPGLFVILWLQKSYKITNLIVPMPCSKLNCHPPCSSDKTNKQTNNMPHSAHGPLRHHLPSAFPITCCWKRTFSRSSVNHSFSISFTAP